MFRVKKDDYNTVQFLPEYKSTTKAKNSSMQSPRRRRSVSGKIISFIAIILLIAAIFVTAFIYFQYLIPSKQFIITFKSGDIEKATQICKDNVYDEGFLNSIHPFIKTISDEAFTAYQNGTLSAAEALEKLNSYNDMTDKHFNDYISELQTSINSKEEIKSDLDEARQLCETQNFAQAIDMLATIAEKGNANNIEVTEDITSIIESYAANFKIFVFDELISESFTKQFNNSRQHMTFINTYLQDSSITVMLENIDKLEQGQIYPRNLRYELREIIATLQQTLELSENSDVENIE